jgi:hypothetical protein
VNLERLRWGEWIAAICALDLLLVTFRSWYKVTGGGHVTAWDALEQGRYLLLVTAAAGIFLWIARAAEDTPERFPIGWVTAVIGLACTVYIAYRLATPPQDNMDPDIGLFLGLASALGVGIGGLLSAREPEPASYAGAAAPGEAAPGEDNTGPAAGYPPPPSNSTWSPAAPAASTTGWSPAAPAAAAVPAATAAGAAESVERPLRSGDLVVLTAGGARFPAGTVAEVVEAFAGGALVEVKASDGMAERFEVPESAYERAPAGAPAGARGAGEDWSPAMPAPATEDWGFDDGGAAAAGGGAAGLDDPAAADEPKPAKVPWWKREIGGGKKKEAEAAGLAAGAAAAGAAGAAAIHAGKNGAGDEKPGFFKRVFGGGSKPEPETETLEAESTPATDVAGIGQAAESDTAVDEPAAESAVEPEAAAPTADEPATTSEPAETFGGAGAAAAGAGAGAAAAAAASSEPEPEPAAHEPEAAAAEPDIAAAEPEAAAAEPEAAGAPEAEPPAGPAQPASAAEPEAAPSESEPPTSDAAPPASPAGEPEAAAEPEPPAAPDPEPVASDEPEAASSGPDLAAGAAGAGAGAAAAGAASAASSGDTEEEPKPKRKRSSGSRKVPKEALAAAGGGDQPKVGDEVELKVGGGRFDAGTKGTVVDVFSAGVIVELSDDEGRTERLDLPFEAIGPADK